MNSKLDSISYLKRSASVKCIHIGGRSCRTCFVAEHSYYFLNNYSVFYIEGTSSDSCQKEHPCPREIIYIHVCTNTLGLAHSAIEVMIGTWTF